MKDETGKVENQEVSTMTTYVLVGDLHAGNLLADIKQFIELINKISVPAIKKLIIVGDLIDASNMYTTQALGQFHPARDIQRLMQRWLAKEIFSKFNETIIVLGNHDRNKEGMELDIDGMRKFADVKVVEDYVDELYGVYVTHYSLKRSSGSRYTSWTGMMMYFALQDIRYIEHEHHVKIKYYVIGHIHKSLSIMQTGDVTLISLPSFYVSNRKERRVHVPALIELDPVIDNIRIIRGEPREDDEIMANNYELIGRIIKMRKELID